MVDCNICLDRLKSPVATPCGHLACSDCLKSHVRASTDAMTATCPTCRKTFNTVTPDLAYVPQKYHTFIVPPVHRIYFDDRAPTPPPQPSPAEAGLRATACALEDALRQANARAAHAEGANAALKHRVARLTEGLAARDAELRDHHCAIDGLNNALARLGKEQAEEWRARRRVKELKAVVGQREDVIVQLEKAVRRREREVVELKARLGATSDPATRPTLPLPALGTKRKSAFFSPAAPKSNESEVSASNLPGGFRSWSALRRGDGMAAKEGEVEEPPQRQTKRQKSLLHTGTQLQIAGHPPRSRPASTLWSSGPPQATGMHVAELGSPFKTPQPAAQGFKGMQGSALPSELESPLDGSCQWSAASVSTDPTLTEGSEGSVTMTGHGLAESLRRATRSAGSRTSSASSLVFGAGASLRFGASDTGPLPPRHG